MQNIGAVSSLWSSGIGDRLHVEKLNPGTADPEAVRHAIGQEKNRIFFLFWTYVATDNKPET